MSPFLGCLFPLGHFKNSQNVDIWPNLVALNYYAMQKHKHAKKVLYNWLMFAQLECLPLFSSILAHSPIGSWTKL
jgi:hypothetical protein